LAISLDDVPTECQDEANDTTQGDSMALRWINKIVPSSSRVLTQPQPVDTVPSSTTLPEGLLTPTPKPMAANATDALPTKDQTIGAEPHHAQQVGLKGSMRFHATEADITPDIERTGGQPRSPQPAFDARANVLPTTAAASAHEEQMQSSAWVDASSSRSGDAMNSRLSLDPQLKMEILATASDKSAGDLSTTAGSTTHTTVKRTWLGRAVVACLGIAVLLQWGLFCQSLWQQGGVFAIVAVALNVAMMTGFSVMGIRVWQRRQQHQRLMTIRQQSLMLQQHQGYGQSQTWLRQLAQQLKRPNADLTGARPEWTDAEVVQIAACQWLGPIEWQVQQLRRRAAVEGALACSLSPVALLDILLISWRANRLAVDIANAYGAELSRWQRGRLMKKFLQLLLWTAGSDIAFDAATELSSVELTAKISGRLSQGVLVGIWLHRFGRFCQQELQPIALHSESPPALQKALKGQAAADASPWWQDLFAQLKQRRASVRTD